MELRQEAAREQHEADPDHPGPLCLGNGREEEQQRGEAEQEVREVHVSSWWRKGSDQNRAAREGPAREWNNSFGRHGPTERMERGPPRRRSPSSPPSRKSS